MPRRSWLILPLTAAMALSTSACGVPLAVTAASYGADGVLALATDKTSTDHALSMATKDDCSIWRIFRHQVVCKDRKPGQKDPYHVNYDEPFNMGPDGYAPPLHSTDKAPARSWDQAAYKDPAAPAAEPMTATAEAVAPIVAEPAAAPAPAPVVASAPVKKKSVAKTKAAKAKKPAPGQVASAR